MANSEAEIANLLYRYAESIDTGDLAGAAGLFAHARLKMPTGEVGHEELRRMFEDDVILYEDGTPRTKHVTTNPIIEVDEAAGRATCRSYYTVLQQVGDGPVQPIISGRYHDRFERVDGRWRFSHRDYSLYDLVGDLSRHSRRIGAALRKR